MANYTSLQAIRKMAGVQNLAIKEVPTGAVDGSNAIFYTLNTPLVDTQFAENGGLQTTDVLVYVNGALANVSAVEAATGKITLDSAPANGAEVEITYAYSAVSDTLVSNVRNQAQDWVNSYLEGIVIYSDYTYADHPGVLTTATNLYAAGIILIEDYGSSVDTDLSSKDGYKKMAQAKELIKEYIANISDDPGSTSPTSVVVTGNGEIFTRNTDLSSGTETTADDEFFNKDN